MSDPQERPARRKDPGRKLTRGALPARAGTGGGRTADARPRRAAREDVGAFDALVREHSGPVYRVALRMLGARDAQDASQEAWIGERRNIKNFGGDGAFTTWLYRITMNT